MATASYSKRSPTVYEAVDITSAEKVAVKILNSTGMDVDRIQESFYRELEALESLDHENIVKLYESGTTENGDLFLVLELMSHDLHSEKRIRSESRENHFLGWDTFWEHYGRPILEAIAHCHQQSTHITHRDIKPENVLLSKQGQVKVADFGICKIRKAARSSSSDRTLTLGNLTSPPFGPPEACQRAAMFNMNR